MIVRHKPRRKKPKKKMELRRFTPSLQRGDYSLSIEFDDRGKPIDAVIPLTDHLASRFCSTLTASSKREAAQNEQDQEAIREILMPGLPKRWRPWRR